MSKREQVEKIVERILSSSITKDYIHRIVDVIIDDVVADVNETADADNWNKDDVRLAIGRIILKKFKQLLACKTILKKICVRNIRLFPAR